MNIKDIITFFDKHAPSWDSGLKINEKIIDEILKIAQIQSGDRVLDIACGTGVLFPFYLKAGVKDITGVDVSPKMIEIAKAKFNGPNINLICADAQTYDFNKKFDKCVIFNALPHFTNLEKLFSNLAKYLKPQGVITIAHDKSREEINKHHEHKASGVSNELLRQDELKLLMEKYFDVSLDLANNHEFYIVTGKKL